MQDQLDFQVTGPVDHLDLEFQSSMKVTTPEISWHERDPIYSVDIQPGQHRVQRLVSGGVDKFVRIWQIKKDGEGKASVEFLANLKRHTKAVNVCRFSPDGEVLATAGDDSVIIFWKLNDTSAQVNNIFAEEEEDNMESWGVLKVLRGHLEDIYDICWSADRKYMISGSVDNTAILWDLTKDQKMCLFNDHQSFVQGVAWDPKNEFAATLSTDRCCRVFSVANRNCIHTIKKMSLPTPPTTTTSENGETKENKPKSFRMFHDDTMRSFFRRLTFTPDGELLIVPSGLVETDPVTNATFVFTRNCLSKPALYLPSPEKVTIAVRCCPTKFELRKTLRPTSELPEEKEGEDLKEWEKYSTLFCLPYRVVFAVATEDAIQLYDTQQAQPFGFITNVHYHQLSDIAWSSDGRTLVVSSTDGYCTLVCFGDGELGTPYLEKAAQRAEDSESSNCSTETDKDVVAMETDPDSEGLCLLLDTSTDARDTTASESEGQGQPSPVPPPKPMAIQVRSADGKPRNIQITTLSTKPVAPKETAPAIQVKSADGKPKNVQIETLASYTSPKSKSVKSDSAKHEERSDKRPKEILKESSNTAVEENSKDTGETVKTVGTPKQAKPVNGDRDKKPTPKRVQITTLQLFKNSSQNKDTENAS